MVISNPFVQLLLLIAIRGVSSPPLLTSTILFCLAWAVCLPRWRSWQGPCLPAWGKVWSWSDPPDTRVWRILKRGDVFELE